MPPFIKNDIKTDIKIGLAKGAESASVKRIFNSLEAICKIALLRRLCGLCAKAKNRRENFFYFRKCLFNKALGIDQSGILIRRIFLSSSKCEIVSSLSAMERLRVSNFQFSIFFFSPPLPPELSRKTVIAPAFFPA